MPTQVTALESVTLGTPDLRAAKTFYEDTWALDPVLETETSVFLRGTGAFHHIVRLVSSDRAEIVSVSLSAETKDNVDSLHEYLSAPDVGYLQDPQAENFEGGGYGFHFKDTEGRNIQIVSGRAHHSDAADQDGRPRKLTHVVLNAHDSGTSSAFYISQLGFKLTDYTKGLDFLRCNENHHAIGITRSGGPTLNHIAFEMPAWDSVMAGAGRMKQAGYPLEWGIGRHGPGNNIFAYFVGPDDVAIEYTADVEQISDDHQVRGSDHWTWLSEKHEVWGLAGPPSDRLKKVFKHLPFSESLPLD